MKLRDLWPMAVTFPLLFLPLIDWSLEQQVPQKMTEVDGRVVDVHEYPCHHDDDSAADARRCYELSVAYAGDLAAQLTFNYRQTRYGEVHVGDHLPVLVPTAQAAGSQDGSDPDQGTGIGGLLLVFGLALFARGCLASWRRVRRRANYRVRPG